MYCFESAGFIDVGNNHPAALASQPPCDDTAESAASGPGDDGNFVAKLHG
jgi:hypothetical protein